VKSERRYDPAVPAPSGPPDYQKLKEAFVDSWNKRADEWEAWSPIVDAWFAPATQLLLKGLELKPGAQVLELAAGSGGFTRYLAKEVGPSGQVQATDSGPKMVKLLTRNAKAHGLVQVRARVMDGEAPDLADRSMDAIACRQGVFFFADPPTAFRRLFRILKPGGRLSVSVFTTPEHNPFLFVPQQILVKWAHPDGDAPVPPPGPGPFSLGQPGQIARLLEGAGFAHVRTQVVPCPLKMPTIDDLLKFYHQNMGYLIEEQSAGRQRLAWDEVRDAVADFVGPGTRGAPSEIAVASARRA
jgi:SAM-dependent methyltransferase